MRLSESYYWMCIYSSLTLAVDPIKVAAIVNRHKPTNVAKMQFFTAKLGLIEAESSETHAGVTFRDNAWRLRAHLNTLVIFQPKNK